MFDSGPALGIAYSDYVPRFLAAHPDALDYVEVPFENLYYSPGSIDLPLAKPVVLHCASLSIAGDVPPTDAIVRAVQHWVDATATPWLGEHLAFVTAQGTPERARYDVGYAINSPTNEDSLALVLRAIDACNAWFPVPLLLENPPVYFTLPGSTMTQVEFLRELCSRSSVRLLVDLTHLYISAHARGVDPFADLTALPLDRIDEVHISGASLEGGALWDNHTTRAPDIVFDLLAAVLERGRPRGITLEYNWSVKFPIPVLLEEIDRTRGLVSSLGRCA
jgi:uncharacterized protein (UPF0276 family)